MTSIIVDNQCVHCLARSLEVDPQPGRGLPGPGLAPVYPPSYIHVHQRAACTLPTGSFEPTGSQAFKRAAEVAVPGQGSRPN